MVLHLVFLTLVLLSAPAFAQGVLSFRLVIPEGTTVCKVFQEGQTAEEEYRRLAMAVFVPGTINLPTQPGVYPQPWLSSLLFGPEQLGAAPVDVGSVTLEISGSSTLRQYTYSLGQHWRVGKMPLALRIEYLGFVVRNGVPDATEIVFDERRLSGNFFMHGVLDDGGEWPSYLPFASCTYEGLPQWIVYVDLGEGYHVKMLRPHRPPMAGSGPANLVRTEATLPIGKRVVSDYWHLVYAADHHNWNEKFWTLFDPPIGEVYGVGVYHREWGEPTSVHYLDRTLRPGPALPLRDYRVIPASALFSVQ